MRDCAQQQGNKKNREEKVWKIAPKYKRKTRTAGRRRDETAE
jgi:hypothetical protein